MATGDIYRVTFTVMYAAQQTQYIHHWRAHNNTVNAAALRTLYGPIGDMQAQFAQVMHTTAWLANAVIRRLNGNTPDTATQNNPTTLKGVATGTPLPPELAVYIKWNTGIKSRRRVGHNYMGSLTGDQVANSRLSSSGASAFQNFINQIMSRWGPTGTSTNWRFGVWSRVIGEPPGQPVTVAGWQQIISGEPTQVITRNRKRKAGVGN